MTQVSRCTCKLEPNDSMNETEPYDKIRMHNELKLEYTILKLQPISTSPIKSLKAKQISVAFTKDPSWCRMSERFDLENREGSELRICYWAQGKDEMGSNWQKPALSRRSSQCSANVTWGQKKTSATWKTGHWPCSFPSWTTSLPLPIIWVNLATAACATLWLGIHSQNS